MVKKKSCNEGDSYLYKWYFELILMPQKKKGKFFSKKKKKSNFNYLIIILTFNTYLKKVELFWTLYS